MNESTRPRWRPSPDGGNRKLYCLPPRAGNADNSYFPARLPGLLAVEWPGTSDDISWRSLARRVMLCVLSMLVGVNALAQQEFVSRYDVFQAFSVLSTSNLNLFQRGYNEEFGVNLRRWVAVGGDFSILSGHSSLGPNLLATAQQAKLAPFLPLLPPGASISVPYESSTYTFCAGPQFNFRKFSKVTLFARPALGGMHQVVTAKPNSGIATVVVGSLLGPSGQKSDTVLFYGFGGGFDINASRHIGIRLAADLVHASLFSGLLKAGQNNLRLSAGPTFRFGRNVK